MEKNQNICGQKMFYASYYMPILPLLDSNSLTQMNPDSFKIRIHTDKNYTTEIASKRTRQYNYVIM